MSVAPSSKCATSRLSCGTAVTVELDGASEPGAVQPGKGSFWAEVVSVPAPLAAEAFDVARQAQMYGVRRQGAAEGSAPEQVRRLCLLCVSDLGLGVCLGLCLGLGLGLGLGLDLG